MERKCLNRPRTREIGREARETLLSRAELQAVAAAGDPDAPKDTVRPPLPSF